MPSQNILIVDDEEDIRTMLGLVLPHHGFPVMLAASGSEALEVYRRHQETISLVLLDVQMQGLDGPATLAALQKINSQVRCCFMSGYTGTYTFGKLRSLGVIDLIEKPFTNLDELVGVLRQLIGRLDR